MRNTSLLAAPAEPVIENDLPLDLSCNSRRRSEDEEDDGEFRTETDRRSSLNGRMMENVKETDMRSAGLSIGGPPSPPRSPTSDFRALSDLGYVAYHRQLMAMERQRQWLLEQHAAEGSAAQQDGEDENAKDRDRSRRHYRIHRFQRHQRRNKTKNNEEGEEDDDDDGQNGGDEPQPLDGDDDLLIMRRQQRRSRRSPLGYDDDEDDEEDEEECLGSDAEGDSDDSHQNPMDLGLANPKAYKKSLMKRYRKLTLQQKKTPTEIQCFFLGHLLHISFNRIPFPFFFFEGEETLFLKFFFFFFCLLFMAFVSVSCRTHFAIVWS